MTEDHLPPLPPESPWRSDPDAPAHTAPDTGKLVERVSREPGEVQAPVGVNLGDDPIRGVLDEDVLAAERRAHQDPEDDVNSKQRAAQRRGQPDIAMDVDITLPKWTPDELAEQAVAALGPRVTQADQQARVDSLPEEQVRRLHPTDPDDSP